MSSQLTRIKICGIKEAATLHAMRGLSVDYIGFMFAKSRRQITAEQACKLEELSRSIPMAGGKAPLLVGVFVNPTLEELADVLSKVTLDVIQLHGQETAEFCREVHKKFQIEVWRALAITDRIEPESMLSGVERLTDYKGIVTTILLDTAGGGTGRPFQWDVIPAYQAAANHNGLRLMIAGGLNPDNVGELIRTYQPQGVDISSGVETNGVKDSQKITAFAERVRSL